MGNVALVSSREAELNVVSWYEEHACAADPQTIKNVEALGVSRAFYVSSSHVDKRFRGKGLGQLMYAQLAIEAYKNFNAAVIPDSAVIGGSTSFSAQRVWYKLAQSGFKTNGNALIATDSSVLPRLNPRYHRGFIKTDVPRVKSVEQDD